MFNTKCCLFALSVPRGHVGLTALPLPGGSDGPVLSLLLLFMALCALLSLLFPDSSLPFDRHTLCSGVKLAGKASLYRRTF